MTKINASPPTHTVSPLTNWPRPRTRPPPLSYGNQRLQRQFDGLLMMGIIMPETCWAVSVRQSNEILRLIVASSWVFYLSSDDCVCYTLNMNSLERGMMLLPQGKRAALLSRGVLRRARSTATPTTALLLQGWLEWYGIELGLLGWNLLHTWGVDAGIRLWHSEHVLRVHILIFIVLICVTTPVLLPCYIKYHPTCIPLWNA